MENKREYSLVECIFAWFSLLAGYLLCRFFPATESPFASLIIAVIIFAVTVVVLVIKGAKIKGMPLFALASSLLLLCSLFLSSNKTVYFFVYLYAILSYMYFVSASFGNALSKGFSNLILADYFRALFVLPFNSFAEVFSALSQGKGKQGARLLLKVLGGIAIAFIPTLIIAALLSYDAGFVDILDKMFDFDFLTIFINIISVLFGIPVGMYIYGAFISSVDKKCENILPAASFREAKTKMQKVPVITAVSAALPPLALYVIFFVSQFKYYVSGFVGVLPDNESYAEYARSGFFQLCTVSVINLIVIIALTLFMKRKGKMVVLKTINILYSVSTLILMSTAASKMALYINEFGLTPKRVYASWFMILLAVIFVLIIVKQFAPKFKIIPVSLIVTVAMSLIITLGGTEQFIAKYNVDRYLSGSLETVDVYAIAQLKDSGIPQLVRLVKHFDEENGTDIKETLEDFELRDYYRDIYEEYVEVAEYLNEFKYSSKYFKLKKLTLPRILAEKAMNSL